MNYNHEDAVTIRTNGRKNDASALWALRDVLEGKSLVYDMTDNKTCSVDILSVSLGEEGYLIIPRQTRELCEPLVKAADALERALEDLPVDEVDKNRIARLSAELMAQAEQYAVELGIQAYLEFTRTLTPEMRVGLEGHKDNEVPET